jgi:hypothetical protein
MGSALAQQDLHAEARPQLAQRRGQVQASGVLRAHVVHARGGRGQARRRGRHDHDPGFGLGQ